MGYCKKCSLEINSKFCPNCGNEAVFSQTEPIKNEREELLDSLYALRAGLSRVSLEKDKVCKLEVKLENKKRENQEIIDNSKNKNGDIKWFEGEVAKIKKKHNQKNLNAESAIKDLRAGVISDKKRISEHKRNSLLLSILDVILISVAILIFSIDWDDSFYLVLFSAPFVIGTLVCSYYLFNNIKSIFVFKKLIKSKLDSIESFKSSIMSPDEVWNSISSDADYIEMSNKLDNANSVLYKAQYFNYSDDERAIQIQKQKCLNFYNDLYYSYLSKFNSIIDERDWKNLDLVIYMLETKRANTLQEALQQVDLHRNTEMIANIIVTATTAICQKIEHESNKISYAIKNSVDSINSRLSKIAENQGMLNESINAVNENIKISISTTELQNALIKKSHVTSEQMAEDIAQIKSFVGRPYGHN